ncbi:MAG TPA: tetratricopeptide repeat protein [Longimicrobium sp.]|nr:tetratricopeptide repeat protein [Longimicrobium sp.]
MTDTAPVSDLAGEARALAGARDWSGLVSYLDAVPEERLYAEPEAAFLLADALWRLAEPARAAEVASRVLALAGQRGDQRLVLRALNVLGISFFNRGAMAEAEEHFAALLDGAANHGDEVFVARAANNLGMIANIRGERDQALPYYVRAMAGYRREGNERGLAQTHHNLGITYRDLGFDSDADTHFRRAIELAASTNTEEVVAMAETERALMRVRSGDAKLGGEMARRALERCRRIGDPLGEGHAARVIAAACRAEQRPDEALERLGEALEIARVHSDALLHAEVQRDRGEILRERGEVEAAREAFADAAAHFEALGAAAEAQALRAILASLEA